MVLPSAIAGICMMELELQAVDFKMFNTSVH